MSKLKVGDVVTSVKLKNVYGTYAVEVLRSFGYTESANEDRKKGQRISWKVVKELPAEDVYKTMLTKKYTTTVGSLIGDAEGERDSLRDELQDWYDNLPESFQNGDKGSTIEEAISQLENADFDFGGLEDLGLYELPALHYPALKQSSRADRCCEISAMLRSACESLDGFVSEFAEGGRATEIDRDKFLREKLVIEDAAKKEEVIEDFTGTQVQEFIDGLEEIASDLEGVEFPTMYG